MRKKLDTEKNDAPNYWKISNDTNKHYVDIMNTKSDLSESEYNSSEQNGNVLSECRNVRN